MVDIQPTTTTQPISDDQELAKALAGVDSSLQFEETPVAAPAPVAEPVADATTPDPIATPAFAPAADDLTTVKDQAITELRPLVDKLNLPAEEKFDTYLLLLRSTDDKTLIAPAHTAAQAITDETRRAQALLDIIKEIDYLSIPGQAPTL
jgi:hypothetical protein